MSWRLSFVALVPLALACSDGTTAPRARPALAVDPSITIRVLPNLDGNNVTVTSFNQYDVVAGYRTVGATTTVFRSRNAIEYFTPPAGFQPGNIFPIAPGINVGGRVVSGIVSDTAYRAFIWWHNGGTTLLPPEIPFVPNLGRFGCGAYGVNDSGYVVGVCQPNSNYFLAVWAPDGKNTVNECCGQLLAVSNNRYLTGYSLVSPLPQALVWAPGAAGYTILGVSGGHAEYSEGLGVNSSGWVAGFAAPNGIPAAAQATLWVPGQSPRILSHVGQAAGVDDRGNVVGFHQDTTGAPKQAFLWNFATGAHFLPGLPGGSQTAAVAINNVNPEILGWAIDAHGLKHAVIWTFPRT